MTTPNFVCYESSEIGDGNSDDCNFDFVFIDKNFEGRISDDDSYDDGDSYDYCEDVYTILSNNGNGQGNRDDCSLLTQASDDDLSTPTSGLKDSILTLPSLLMKDLDEAHEAAKLIRITDPEEETDADSAQIVDDKLTNERHDSQPSTSLISNENSSVGEIATEESSSLVPMTKLEKAPIPTLWERSTGRTIIFLSSLQTDNVLPSTETVSRLLASKSNEKHSNEDNKSASNAITTSRTSNKKRRKKLKMLKKTQAAAAAAERIQHQSAFCQQKTSNKYQKRNVSSSPKKQASSRYASKKVGNIAVSCAIETMATFRDELSRQQGKQNKQQAVTS
eukprot:jgi/Psemu1/285124/fgenesh1_pg.74_\